MITAGILVFTIVTLIASALTLLITGDTEAAIAVALVFGALGLAAAGLFAVAALSQYLAAWAQGAGLP